MTRPLVRGLGLLGNTGFQHEVGLLRFYTRYPRWQLRRRLLPGDPNMTLPTGLRLRLPRSSPLSGMVYVSNCNTDWGGDSLLLDLLNPARDFLDVGANFGYYSLLAAPLVRRVYAFEPDPRNLHVLAANCARADNAEIVPRAVSARSGPAHLDVSGDPTVSRLSAEPSHTAVRVAATSLDDFALERPGLDVAAIKIDVEGFDLDVIRGAHQLIARDQPVVFTEFGIGPLGSNDVAELFSFVARIPGYSVFGHLCDVRARDGRAARLRELIPEEAARFAFKMLFLVPSHLRARLVDLASADGSRAR